MLSFIETAVKEKKELCFYIEPRGRVKVRTADDVVKFVPHEHGVEFRVEKDAGKKPSGYEIAPITVALHEVDSIYIPLDSCAVSAE